MSLRFYYTAIIALSFWLPVTAQVKLDKHQSHELLKRIIEAKKSGQEDLAVYLIHRKDTIINKKELSHAQLEKYAKTKGELGAMRRKIWGPLSEFLLLEKKFLNKDFVGALGIFETDTFFVEHLNYFKERYYNLYDHMSDIKMQLDSDKRVAINDYKKNFLGSEIHDLGWSGSTNTCSPGQLSTGTYDKIVQRWQYFRRLTNTPTNLRLDPEFNDYAQKAALILASNDSLLSVLEDTIPCYTHKGHTGLKYSRTNFCEHTDEMLTDMIIGENDEQLEQRKLILNPETNIYGFGAAVGHNGNIYEVNYVDGGRENIDDKDIPPFLAYPAPGFFPNSLIFPKWSFTISTVKADFSQSRVIIRTMSGRVIPVDIITHGGTRGGQSIIWKMRDDGIEDYVDKVLDITIQRVKAGGEYRDYNYSIVFAETRPNPEK